MGIIGSRDELRGNFDNLAIGVSSKTFLMATFVDAYNASAAFSAAFTAFFSSICCFARARRYWVDGSGYGSKIARASLNGTGVEDVVVNRLQWPHSLAIHAAGGKMCTTKRKQAYY